MSMTYINAEIGPLNPIGDDHYVCCPAIIGQTVRLFRVRHGHWRVSTSRYSKYEFPYTAYAKYTAYGSTRKKAIIALRKRIDTEKSLLV